LQTFIQSDYSTQAQMSSSNNLTAASKPYEYTTVQHLFRDKSIRHYIKFIEQSKKLSSLPPVFSFNPDPLLSFIPTGTQRDVLRFVDNFLQNKLDPKPNFIRLAILGPAGTGKTVLGQVICKKLKQFGKKFTVVGPTGVSSANLGGSTIHSFLNIPYKGFSNFQSLLNSPITCKFREKVRALDFIIVDEC